MKNKDRKITNILIKKDGTKIYQYDDSDAQSKFGMIKKEDIKKAKQGDELQSNTKEKFNLLVPSFMDKYSKIRKGAQTIPLKDLGFIISYTGIGKDSIVYEAGSGSGGSGIFFANIVKKVYSFEIREDHLEITKKNVEMIGLKNVILKLKDITDSFGKNNDADLVLLDLPEPWKAIDSAISTMKVGSWLVIYSPNTTQISTFVEEAKTKKQLIYDMTKEVMVRNWDVDGRICHPSGKNTIGHSAFLAFFRKIND